MRREDHCLVHGAFDGTTPLVGYLVHLAVLVLVVDSCWKVAASSLCFCHLRSLFKGSNSRRFLGISIAFYLGESSRKYVHDQFAQSPSGAPGLGREALE